MTRMLKGCRHGVGVVAVAWLAALGTGLAAWQPVRINGSGATFPEPIYQKWFSEYNKLRPEIQISYQPLGSAGGIRQLTNQTVFFALRKNIEGFVINPDGMIRLAGLKRS